MATHTHPPSTPADTIVLAHGLWVTPRRWEKRIELLTNRGHRG